MVVEISIKDPYCGVCQKSHFFDFFNFPSEAEHIVAVILFFGTSSVVFCSQDVGL